MLPSDVPSPGSHASTPDDDVALMRAITAGEAAALRRLYDRHSPLVFAFCLRALRDRAEAEDLVVDIFWEIWQRQERYDPARSSPRTYLLNVTRSRIIDRLRALRARRTVAVVRLEDGDGARLIETTQQPGPCEPIDNMVGAEQRARLRAAMQRLTPDQREALEMAYFDALSHSEVAARLREPIGTVKSRIRQALIRLREVLGGTAP